LLALAALLLQQSAILLWYLCQMLTKTDA
jgi:hypothetical protein